MNKCSKHWCVNFLIMFFGFFNVQAHPCQLVYAQFCESRKTSFVMRHFTRKLDKKYESEYKIYIQFYYIKLLLIKLWMRTNMAVSTLLCIRFMKVIIRFIFNFFILKPLYTLSHAIKGIWFRAFRYFFIRLPCNQWCFIQRVYCYCMLRCYFV